MPAYCPLPESVTGPVADTVRRAESLVHLGQLDDACRLLEDTLDAAFPVGSELPVWLCGRLAALYRSLERYGDEVAILERFRDSQTGDDTKRRYDARLSKARLLSARARPRALALDSVRVAMERPRTGATKPLVAASNSGTR